MLISKKLKNFFSFIFCCLLFSKILVVESLFAKDKSNNFGSKILILNLEFSKDKKLSIKLNRETEYKIFTLSNPHRVSIEVQNAVIPDKFSPKYPDFVKKISFNANNEKLIINIFFEEKYITKNTLFDKPNKIISTELILKNSTNQKNLNPASNIATPQSQNNPEIDDIINQIPLDDKPINKANSIDTNKSSNQDLIIKKTSNSIVKYKIRPPHSNSNKQSPNGVEKNINSESSKILTQTLKKPVIVIDAGHGGKDPGTIGVFARTKEKNITLSYAKELAKHLANEKKYQVYLTRDNDFFIPLEKRVAKSRKKKADLFISLHANSIADTNVSGFSIYTLSETSSDKQAELLAQKENQADIINGIDFSGASKDIMKTLIDLSQRESKNSSAKLAKFIIKEAKKSEIEILQNTHRFAGFMVLTAPDMASVLIELGYLSNKKEEKMLNSSSYRRHIAKTLTNAIEQYFRNFK